MNIFQAIINWFKRLFGFKDDVVPPIVAGVPASWVFQYSPNTTISGNTFTFPSIDGAHYLVRSYSGSLVNGLEVTYKIDITGTPVFDFHTNPNNDVPGTGTVTLYFQRRGDNLEYEHYRWFATTDAKELAEGTHTITVPLDPSRWVSVYGKRGDTVLADWQAAINDVGAVGMVFGGGYFAGHGVFVHEGTATMTILDWKAT